MESPEPETPQPACHSCCLSCCSVAAAEYTAKAASGGKDFYEVTVHGTATMSEKTLRQEREAAGHAASSQEAEG